MFRMTKKNFIISFSLKALTFVLITAMALCITACNESPKDDLSSAPQTSAQSVTEVGTGNTKFDFTVIDSEGKETKFLVFTNKEFVGEALLDAKLIEGEESEYGLFVKKVNGITADYDIDGTYWSFEINGQYASSGVDTTKINPEDKYAFKVAK